MCHVDDVVDDLAAVGALDDHRVPRPLGPVVAVRAVDAGDAHLVGRRIALGVVPDEQLPVPFEGRPGAGAGQWRHSSCIRNLGALAVCSPPPVVERAGYGVALDRALGEVAAHVAAVPVEDDDFPRRLGKHHEFGAERPDRMRLAVGKGLDEAEAMPAAGVARRCLAHVNFTNFCHVHSSASHRSNTRTRYRIWSVSATDPSK